MERVGVVICNYNKQNDVLNCVQSILENTYQDCFLYVVDNASKDDSVKLLQEKFGDVDNIMLIVNEENLGGSGGFNTGLRIAFEKGHEYLMCVDNDAMLDEGCIAALVDHLDRDPESGIAAAKIYHAGMEDYVQHYGSFIGWENFDVNSIFLNHYEDGTMPEVVYSDAVPACAMLTRRSLIEKIGFLPEENFLYWDDTEFCVRATMAGYQVASVGKAQAVHTMGAKREDVNTFPTYYGWRNWVKFFVDHVPNSMIDRMAESFLGAIFDVNYSCLYRKEPNRINTVMAAVDDALHGVTGKAGPNRIFDLENTYDGIERAVEGKDEIVILGADFPLYAGSLRDQLTLAHPEKTIRLIEEADASEWKNSLTRAVFRVRESIFAEEDLSLSVFSIDLDGNVLASQDDALYVINYGYARESFIFGHKGQFLLLAENLRA